MVTMANKANEAFEFSPSPLTLENCGYLARCNEEGGLNGSLAMNSGRHSVSVVHNQIEIYSDRSFDMEVFRDPARLEALKRETNYLTPEEARRLADRALKALGLSEVALARLGPPMAQQQKWGERGDELLPVFVVEYPRPGKSDAVVDYYFHFDIFGTQPGGFISKFHNATFGDERFLQVPLSPGYREKVREYLQAVQEKQR